MDKNLTITQRGEIIETLKTRFNKHPQRHTAMHWEDIEVRLLDHPNQLWSLYQMEQTGGEPDVVAVNEGKYVFVDCAAESPIGRRSLCYDKEGLAARKDYKPTNNAIDLATALGLELLDETEYRSLQELGHFDSKTSSWIKTPDEIRKLGGALFGDYRFGKVFVYHNTAQSYYGARGFRAKLLV